MTQQQPWLLTEDKFDPKNQADFSVNNGYITQSGCLEGFSANQPSKQTFMDGIRNADSSQTNLPDWTSVVLRLNSEIVDLTTCEIQNYQRVLNKKINVLSRNFQVKTLSGHTIQVESECFLSKANPHLGCIRFKVKSVDFQGNINFLAVIDGQPLDQSASQWNVLQSRTLADVAHLWIQTRKTNFQVCEAVSFDFFKNNTLKKLNPTKIEKANVAGYAFGVDLVAGESVIVHKYVGFADSIRTNYKELTTQATQISLEAKAKGWEQLYEENSLAMHAAENEK